MVWYGSDDISKIFVNKLAKVTNKIYNDFHHHPIPLKLIHAEQKSFDKAETCHICKKELLNDNGVDKVRDHCHFTGKYRVELLITVAISNVENQ